MKLKANEMSRFIFSSIKPFLTTNYYDMDSWCTSTNDFPKDIYVVVWLSCYKVYIDSFYT